MAGISPEDVQRKRDFALSLIQQMPKPTSTPFPIKSTGKRKKKSENLTLVVVRGRLMTPPPTAIANPDVMHEWQRQKTSNRFNKTRSKRTSKCRSKVRPKWLSVEYIEYMQSSEWTQKRVEAFMIHGRRCNRCGSLKKLQCHHLTYDRLFHEDVKTDLEILCRHCHQNHHGRQF